MKNANDYQLKKCIFLTPDEFEDVLHIIYPDSEIDVAYSMDGLTVDVDEDCPDDEDFHKKLADYYDVAQVTSLHIDDCDCVGVWIVYKENAD